MPTTMQRITVSAAVALALTIVACGNGAPGASTSSSAASPPADGPLAVGAAAPDVTLKLSDGKEVKLADLATKTVLVYFYPKDDTPGCTAEANGIKDSWQDFESAGVAVYGVSTQDAASHEEFISKYSLPFPLVVDTDKTIAKAFGVPTTLGYAKRQSFLLKDGKVVAMWPDVDPKAHAGEVLAAAKKG